MDTRIFSSSSSNIIGPLTHKKFASRSHLDVKQPVKPLIVTRELQLAMRSGNSLLRNPRLPTPLIVPVDGGLQIGSEVIPGDTETGGFSLLNIIRPRFTSGVGVINDERLPG